MAKRSRNPGPPDNIARAPLVLARRTCTVCDWAAEVVEPIEANPDCPWCHGPTERVSATVLEPAPPATKSGKNPAAAALGRLGGSKGGRARAAKLSAKRRRAIAIRAAKARWQKKKR